MRELSKQISFGHAMEKLTQCGFRETRSVLEAESGGTGVGEILQGDLGEVISGGCEGWSHGGMCGEKRKQRR